MLPTSILKPLQVTWWKRIKDRTELVPSSYKPCIEFSINGQKHRPLTGRVKLGGTRRVLRKDYGEATKRRGLDQHQLEGIIERRRTC